MVGTMEDRNTTIHQAIGMLAAQLDWPVTHAFAQLRVYAVASGQTLDDAALDVVGGVRMSAPPAGEGLDGTVLLTRPRDVPMLAFPRPAGRGARPSCTAYARPRYAQPHLLTDRPRRRPSRCDWTRVP